MGLVTHYVLFLIQLETRHVCLAGITQYPDKKWMQQQARNVTMKDRGFSSIADTCCMIATESSVRFDPVELTPFSAFEFLGPMGCDPLRKQRVPNKAILEMSSTAGAYGIKIKDLTVDCAPGGTGTPPANCIGIENVNAGQNSTVEDVSIDNASGEGLHISVGGPSALAANSGPYRNITVQYSSSACTNCTGTYGVVVDCGTLCATPSPVPVHFDNITAQGAGTNTNKNGFLTVGVPVVLTNSHFEQYLGMNVQIGDGTIQTNNVRIDNVSMGMGNGIVIMPNVYNVVLTGVSGPSQTQNYVLVKNEYVSLGGSSFPQITGPMLGYYMFGGKPPAGTTCGKSNGISIPCVPLLDTSPVAAEWHTPAN